MARITLNTTIYCLSECLQLVLASFYSPADIIK